MRLIRAVERFREETDAPPSKTSCKHRLLAMLKQRMLREKRQIQKTLYANYIQGVFGGENALLLMGEDSRNIILAFVSNQLRWAVFKSMFFAHRKWLKDLDKNPIRKGNNFPLHVVESPGGDVFSF